MQDKTPLVAKDSVELSIPVWFSSLESSQLRPKGLVSEKNIERDTFWTLKSDWTIVFRYAADLHREFFLKKKITLETSDRKYRLLELVDFNCLQVYSLANLQDFK